jgi:formate-dependent nitrite reductase membrane component NrfD
MLGFSGIGLIILLLITLLTYIEVVRQSGVTPAASVNLLKSFFFIVGVIVLGLLVPLGLLIIGVFQDNLQTLVVLEGVAAVLILFGGLMLRYTVVKNGVRMALN